jgi:DNA-directed RNA polymerase subunit RPC12/RpoP
MAYIMYICPECRSYFKTGSSGKKIKCPKCAHKYLLDLKTEDARWKELDKEARNKIIEEAKAGTESKAGEKTEAKVAPGVVSAIKETVDHIKSGNKENKDDKDNSGNKENTDNKDNKEESTEEAVRTPLNRKYVAIAVSTAAVLIFLLVLFDFIIPAPRIKREVAALKKASCGDTVEFGKFKGNRNWVVLDRKDDLVLCMSEYPVGDEPCDVAKWPQSRIRDWLNSAYMNSTFSIFERLRIISTKDVQDIDPSYSRAVGDDIPDKVFVISDDELKNYLGKDRDDLNDDSMRVVCWIDTSK